MREITKAHRFFIENSREYVGTLQGIDLYGYGIYEYSVKKILYYPIAYIKFMLYSL